jgi:hypothetical protein
MNEPMKWVILAIILLAGCTSIPSLGDLTPQQIAAKSQIRRDDFKKVTAVGSLKVFFGQNDFANQYQFYRLSAERTDRGSVRYFLVFHAQRTHETGFAVWSEVNDELGHRYPLAPQQFDAGVSATDETVYMPISLGFLQGIKSPMKMKIYGKNSEEQFTLSPNFVQGFLDRCKSEFGSV